MTTIDTPQKEAGKIPPEDEGKEPDSEKDKGGEPTPETVTIPNKEYEQLKMTKNLTSNLQDENKRLKNARNPGKKVVAPKPEFPGEEPEPELPSTPSDDDKESHEEFVRLKELVTAEIAQNPKFLKLMGEDSILRRVIASNPLSLLTPQEQANVIDAEDAVDKITAVLEERVSKEDPEENKPGEPEDEKKPPEGMNPDNVPTPPAPEKEKKSGIEGVEESILSKIKPV